MTRDKATGSRTGLQTGATECSPAVSVIIPTYNRAHCLRRAIDSVLAQTFTDFELIVVDDGSTDDTRELLETISDPRLRIVRHSTNKGVGATINSGIRSANGDLIAIQDSDDEWHPDKLERQVAVLQTADASVGVVYCDQWRISGEEKILYPAPHIRPEDGIVFERALDDALYNIGNQSLLVRRECFEKAGLYDERLWKNEDLDMLIRLSRYYRFYHIDDPLLNYYVTPDSVTSRGEAQGIRTQEILFDKYLDDLKKNRRLLAKRAYWIGSFHMREGNAAKGRHFLRMAFRVWPLSPRYAGSFVLSYLGQNIYGNFYRLVKRFS